MSLTLVTAPAGQLVSLAEAKAHLRVDRDDEDIFINGLIAAATTHLDGVNGILGRALLTQAWELRLDGGFPCGPIRLPLPPLQSVTSVAYVDPAGDTQTLDAGVYQVAGIGGDGRVVPAYGRSWPATRCQPEAVTVRFVAGYGDAATDVPQTIRHALLLLVTHWYEHREAVNIGNTVTPLPMTIDALLAPYRVWMV